MGGPGVACLPPMPVLTIPDDPLSSILFLVVLCLCVGFHSCSLAHLIPSATHRCHFTTPGYCVGSLATRAQLLTAYSIIPSTHHWLLVSITELYATCANSPLSL
jgi:hypothetical protein